MPDGQVQRASDVLLKSDSLTQVNHDAYRQEIEELSIVLDWINCGSTSFHVFQDNDRTMGAYDQHGVWLNENLFTPGMRFERIRTMLHEMGHAKGGDDATTEFEWSLDYIAAKLAERLLDK